ncbi:MAG: helix-turn-helix transcriptional regulator [Brevinematia bacterium]
MKKDRLLAIILFLLNKGKATSKELSRHFEVSERTILRDIDSINLAGVPVVSRKGKNGGFEIIEGFKIDRSFFTPFQIDIILTALKGLKSIFGDWQIDEVINKLNLLERKNDLTSKKEDPIFINLFPYFNKSLLSNISILKSAIENNRMVKFNYTNIKNETTEREVEPYKLILYGSSWYLFAYCRVRNDYRNFKISRLKNLITLDKDFIPRILINNGEWEEMWKKDWNNREPKEIILEISKEGRLKAEEFFGKENIMLDQNGKYIVKINYPIDDWLYGFILSLGDNIKVISPEDLKKTIKEKALSIYEKYKF